uniref:Uncharacterized protein n=1 Tax=viral metagenome TaxID=1070528 RepID=A0A6C0JRA9_9ZZZZ
MSNTLISQIDAIFEEANTTARNQVLDLVAKSLAAQTDLFKKKMTAKQILALLMADGGGKKKAAKAGAKKVADDDSDAASDAADDAGDDDEAGDEDAGDAPMPEGWDEKKVKAFWKAYNKMDDGHYLNAVSNRSNDGKKKTGLVRNDKWHICAKTDEKEFLDSVVAYLNANPEAPVAKRGRKATGGKKPAAKKTTKKAAPKDSDDDEGGDDDESDAADDAPAADSDDEDEAPAPKTKATKKAAAKDSDDDEADDEEEADDDAEYVDGYDAGLLEKLKTAVTKAEKGTFVNVATRKIVSNNDSNKKKFKFVANKKLAIPILADDDEMAAYEARLYAMLK